MIEREGHQPGINREIGENRAVFAEPLASQITRQQNAGGCGKKDAAAFAAELREGVLEDFEAYIRARSNGENFGRRGRRVGGKFGSAQNRIEWEFGKFLVFFHVAVKISKVVVRPHLV